MNKVIFRILFLSSAFTVALYSCKKNNAVVDKDIVPPSTAKFNVAKVADTAGIYYVRSTGEAFKIPIGITTVSNQDRKVQLCYTSNTAAAGTQYNAPASITIPAGKALDSLSVQGLFAGYPTSSRVDTLYIKICGGDVAPSAYQNQYRLIMRKYCDVVPANLTGNYANSTDTYNGSPSAKPNYTAVISNWTPISATSASIVIKNLGATSDNGWGPFGPTDPAINPGLTATLDWSNPSNFSVTIPTQNYFNDGSGNSTINATGTFSSCDQTFTINATVKYAGNGSSYKHVSIFKR